MTNYLKIGTTLMVCLSITSCSLFSPGKQAVKVISNDSNAALYVDGEYIGKGQAVAKLSKRRAHSVEAKSGNKSSVAVIDSNMSTTGVLDTIGGFFFLVPFIGLASPGAWELDPEIANVNLH